MHSSSLVLKDRVLPHSLSQHMARGAPGGWISSPGIPCLLAGHLDLLLSFPQSQPGFAPLVEAVEVHHCLVERKSFVSLKLRKQLWKQSPQNNPQQGWVYSAYEFLMLLGSECDFSALK